MTVSTSQIETARSLLPLDGCCGGERFAESGALGRPATHHRRAADGPEEVTSYPGGHRRPESVDLSFGCRQALLCEGDKFGHGGRHLGEGELGRDEARF